ncbi:MAG: AAA family ATPase, partial [Nitrospira sp.]|nr:AAA family ATPase [Nitrospira sp.]
MYEKHFSFKYKPFELVPNPDFFFLSSTHKKAITYLDYGIKEKAGFILLTGEVGSGKTTIIKNLIKDLGNSIKLSRVNNTMVSSEQLISAINEDFGLDVDGKTKTRLLSELNKFLIEQYSKNIQPILLIDEAQNLSVDLLEEIRLLSNLETDRSKLLQIILVGQPELKKTLMLPELIQLRQRISVNYHIAPLSIDETKSYIVHRLAVAGNPDAIMVDDDVLHIIYQFSRGIPRLINILCDFVLLAAFVEGASEVTVDV